jgi:hypothetical protein
MDPTNSWVTIGHEKKPPEGGFFKFLVLCTGLATGWEN